MTAQILANIFTHDHNALEVARQEYEAAKKHFREVMENKVCGIPDHERRYRDAMERQNSACEKFAKTLSA
ncbi:hypothetical protein [Zavarzinella formosa]|uniref:hypothetical protein n=1 Tax=Zavarzinella formosa TaxID=360055 RepID=UPI000379AF90|nr:hypothetical protein [Zavarzinella formosa]